jgi:hypothetical protein
VKSVAGEIWDGFETPILANVIRRINSKTRERIWEQIEIEIPLSNVRGHTWSQVLDQIRQDSHEARH